MILIIILNWNGWRDTIECLDSIYNLKNSFFSVLVIDNGSTDDSVTQLKKYIEDKRLYYECVKEGESLREALRDKELILYKLNQNYGFAKGNNLGLKLISGEKIEYYWILNNDTVIDENSMSVLKNFMDNHKEYYAITPQIRYFSEKNKIWNCGGKISFGFRKYYYADKKDIEFNKEVINISFITGCALFIRPELLNENGVLFTEKFFFGEEDFELSLRMNQAQQQMACIVKSLIFHKVGSSSKNNVPLSNSYIYYLNRYINLRQHFSEFKFRLWRIVSNSYIIFLFNTYKIKNRIIYRFLKRLNRECYQFDGVSKDIFESIRNDRSQWT